MTGKNVLSHGGNLGGLSGVGVGEKALASASHVHDIFAECEEMFSMGRTKPPPQKQKALC